MDKQLHILYYGHELIPEQFQPVYNDRFTKARGGLFTSTYDEKYGSEWVQWCLGAEFKLQNENKTWTGVILTPDTAAKVLTVDSYEDLERIHKEYGNRQDDPVRDMFLGKYLNYEKIAEYYDAFRVTAKGEAQTRFSQPLSLYGWDCESTHWFRWKFTDMQKIENVEFEDGD